MTIALSPEALKNSTITHLDRPASVPIQVTSTANRQNNLARLGTSFSDQAQIKVNDAIILAGLDYSTALVPVVAKYEGSDIELPRERAIIRVPKNGEAARGYSRGVSKDYRLMQNEEVFSILDPLVEEGMKIVSAGISEHGKRSFLLLEAPTNFNVAGDLSKNYLFALNSFTGQNMVSFRIIPNRLDCWNALMMAYRTSKMSVNLPHTTQGMKELRNSDKILKVLRVGQEAVQKNLTDMAQSHITGEQMSHVLNSIFKARAKPEDSTEAAKHRWKQEIEQAKQMREVTKGLHSEFGRNYPEFKGTVYAAYQAITEGSDWAWSKKSPDTARAVVLGERGKVKTRAHELLLNFVTAN